MDNSIQRKETIGKRIRNLRHKLNMTLAELGGVLDIKGSRLSNWEQGTRTPELVEIQKMARFFQVSPSFLAGFSDDMGEYQGLHQPEGSSIGISRERLRESGCNPKATRSHIVRDDNLAPAIPMGAEVILNTAITEPTEACYMGVRIGSQMVIEKVEPAGSGRYFLGERKLPAEEIRFVGRVHMVIIGM